MLNFFKKIINNLFLNIRGYGHPKCYAALLKNCSKDIEHEHYISRSVLKYFSGNGRVNIKGFSWQKVKDFQDIPFDSLTGNILCSRHNRELSILDSEAEKFFKTYDNIKKYFTDPQGVDQSEFYNIYGPNMERWMLKVICGLYAIGTVLSKEGKDIGKFTPNINFLDYLFGKTELPADSKLKFDSGLYFQNSSELSTELFKSIQLGFAPISSEVLPNGSIDTSGVAMSFINFNMILILKNNFISKKIRDKFLNNAFFRPKAIIFHDLKTDKSKGIFFSWGYFKAGENIYISMNPKHY